MRLPHRDRMSSNNTIVLTCLLNIGLLGCGARNALALPSGRAWTPVEHLEAQHLAYAGSMRLEVGRGGIPRLICFAGFDTSGTRRWRLLLNWSESAWVPKFTSNFPAGVGDEWPFLASNEKTYLDWIAPYPEGGYARLLVADVGEDGFGEPDTALETFDSGGEFSGAASARRLWLVRSQQRACPLGADAEPHQSSHVYADTRAGEQRRPQCARPAVWARLDSGRTPRSTAPRIRREHAT